MLRSLSPVVKTDLETKLVLLSGPRQVGKTTLAQSLYADSQYLNFDSIKDQVVIRKMDWARSTPLVIFDELHKMKNWKRFVKGIYDTEGVTPRLLVTGSARLDVARKMGDSLAGRHFLHVLHPLTLRELNNRKDVEANFRRLLTFGGFPEPFIKNSESFAGRWRQSHLDIILRQDLLDLEQVRSIKQLELLINLLRARVGSPVSHNSLAEDLHVDQKTIARWITILENLFVIFSISPYSKNIARATLKQKKYYFYDNGQVEGDEGALLENMVACALLRECDWSKLVDGKPLVLSYARTKDGKEIDFLVLKKSTPIMAVEVKWADDEPSRSFEHFARILPNRRYQVIGTATKERENSAGLILAPAAKWLHQLAFET